MKRIFVLIAIAFLVGIWSFWPSPSDQVLLERSLSRIESGVSDHQLGTVLAEISENYEDETGWSKQSIRGILFREFKKGSHFSLHIYPTAFQITPPTAKITAEVTIVGGSIVHPNAEAEYFEVQFGYKQEEDKVWRLQTHTREQVEK